MSDHEDDRRWHMTYDVKTHPNGIARSEVPDGHGATDAIVILSVIYPRDGGLSVCPISFDGRTDAPMADSEIFKAWLLLTSRLAESESLSKAKRELCESVVSTVREAMLAARDETS